ncbi:MAG: NAD(P)H-hydrate dehydratase [Sedimentitalea sp.]
MGAVLTSTQMRQIEQRAMDAGLVSGLELMERAGQGVVDAIFAQWPCFGGPVGPGATPGFQRGPAPTQGFQWGPAPTPPEFTEKDEAQAWRAVVLCGPGNNGGDGFVIARLLAQAGWSVGVFLLGDGAKLSGDARVNCDRWRQIGAVAALDAVAIELHGPYDLRVDAVFGTGLTRPPSPGLWDAFSATSKSGCLECETGAKRVAVDCPSCLDLESGRILVPGPAWKGDVHLDFFAHLTVTFHRPKLGHFLGDGPQISRKLVCVDIGLDAAGCDEFCAPGVVRRVTGASQFLGKFDNQHKFDHGHALVLSGGPGRTGAARLAARGALRIGVGLVTLGVAPAAQMEVAMQVTAIMVQRVPDAPGLSQVLSDARITAICLGPALGTGARAQSLVAATLQADRAVVLDADALTILAASPEVFSALHSACVLTPHGGEFARLFPGIAAKLAQQPTSGPAISKVEAVRQAAAQAGCVVVLKGADTVIAAPDGACWINAAVYEAAAPWLATAGSGDVLAGFVTGLLARGFDPLEAAKTGVWLHSECARAFGPGLIAEDLPEIVPSVLRDVLG